MKRYVNMNYVNEMAAINIFPTATAVEHEIIEKNSVGKKVMLVVAAAAIALTTGIGAAKICTDCLADCIAYADPIEEVTETSEGAPAVGLLAETLKGTATE